MAVCDYNCSTLPAYALIDCNEYKRGGISAIAVVNCDHQFTNFSDPNEWNTEITAGRATVIKNLRGELPAGTEVESDSPVGCRDTELDGFDMTFSFTNANVTTDNDTFFSKLNGRNTYIALYLCDSDEIIVIEQVGNWAVKPTTIPASRRERQTYEGTFKYFHPKDYAWTRAAAPAGIFE